MKCNGRNISVCSTCGHVRYEDNGQHLHDYLVTRDCVNTNMRQATVNIRLDNIRRTVVR